MHATLNTDIEMMNLLLNRGADVNARSKGDGTSLLWGLHDVEKVKLLLARGATVEDRAVFVAAALSGGCPTLKLLATKGANLNAGKDGYTPLMAATRGGDLDTIRFLIERGADVKARTRSGYTALYGAAVWPESAPIVALLLEHGANPNEQVETSGSASDLFTAAMAAAVRGDADSVELLLASGADANAQGGDFARTALLGAATSGSRQTVRLLLAKGANVNARDGLGNTPLRWARRRADTEVAKLLEEAGGQEPRVADPTQGRSRLHKEPGAGSLERALGKSLPLLQQSGQAFSKRKGCVSCHHQSLVAMAVGLARRHGFKVDEKIATQQRPRVLSTLARNRERILLGGGVSDELLPAYALAGLAAEGQKPNPTTDAAVQFLVLRQRKDGSWFVQTRSFPFQAHVETLFPHGRSQFISVAATSWATMALALTAGAGNQGMD
jgi:ankyrin repeat protein